MWSARTPTCVTAAVSSTAPPGTAIRQGKDVAVPDERVARVHAPRAVGHVGRRGARPGLVVERRVEQGGEEQVAGSPQFTAAQRARLVAQVGLPTS